MTMYKLFLSTVNTIFKFEKAITLYMATFNFILGAAFLLSVMLQLQHAKTACDPLTNYLFDGLG